MFQLKLDKPLAIAVVISRMVNNKPLIIQMLKEIKPDKNINGWQTRALLNVLGVYDKENKQWILALQDSKVTHDIKDDVITDKVDELLYPEVKELFQDL